MRKNQEEIIQIWSYDQVPQSLKRLSGKNSAWVVLIPPNLVWYESEALFQRLHTDHHPITRRALADGSILFSGGRKDDKMRS
jgi:hypothetical protein